MQDIVLFLQNWWLCGLIPSVIGVVLFLWHRNYKRTHVESQFIIEGITLTTIIVVYYIICIITALISLIGALIPVFKFLLGYDAE